LGVASDPALMEQPSVKTVFLFGPAPGTQIHQKWLFIVIMGESSALVNQTKRVENEKERRDGGRDKGLHFCYQ